jgi:XTP/dITP diphosphohydrolase
MRLARGQSLIIATHNKGKLAELRELLLPFGLNAVSAGELGLAEPEETASTFIGNAQIKALAAAKAGNMPALADDSGLSIRALDNRPGVLSARFGAGFAAYPAAMDALTQELEALNIPHSSRHASFVCALTLAFPSGECLNVEAIVEGLIVPQKGTQGFGYDAFFLPDGQSRTFGEMSATEKHGLPPLGLGLSHRAKAFVKLCDLAFPL